MKIFPGVGIEQFRFGLTETDLIQHLGEPDKIVDMKIIERKIYFYNKLMMQFSFDTELDGRLAGMTIESPNVYLWGVNVIGMSKDEVSDLVEKHGKYVAEYEEYDLFEVMNYETLGVEFHFEFDRLNCVELSVWIDEDDTIIWSNENVLGGELPTNSVGEVTMTEAFDGTELFYPQKNDTDAIRLSVELGISLGEVFLGETIADLEMKLGVPDKINDEERDAHIVYYYNHLKAKFYFCSDYDNRLLAIQTFHPETCLWDRKIIGMGKAELENLLDEQKIKQKCYEDYESFDVIFCEEIWAIFCFCYDKLQSIEFSVVDDVDGQLVWPKVMRGEE